MRPLRSFINRHLDPVDRLGEVLFGLIMALGFTGAVRLGSDQATNRELLVSILGCNLAWAIVDGVMYVMLALFERGRKAKLVERMLAATSENAALDFVADEFDETLKPLTSTPQRQQIYRWIAENTRNVTWDRPRLQRADVLGGIAVGLAILVATLPILVPFVLISNTRLAVRLSNAIALLMLFCLGTWWGRVGIGNPWRIGFGMTLVGLFLVVVTIALGG